TAHNSSHPIFRENLHPCNLFFGRYQCRTLTFSDDTSIDQAKDSLSYYPLPITHYPLPTTHYPLPITHPQTPDISCNDTHQIAA
ncbi:MAG: hypothetical protein AAFV72_26740, partial [Cyanobacteria bacterium J06635_1]